ncbi:MAG TPA: hypothetical protein PLX97_01960 [Gemmatales bacterium]|nr:hypothetical protein [Gemmatales bacterium]
MVRKFVASLALVACVGLVMAGDVKSGPEVGKGVGAFHPFNVFNAESSELCMKENCIVCQYGSKPVALVFARKTSKPVADLVKKLDAAVAKSGQEKMGAAVVFLSSEDNIKDSVAKMQTEAGVKNVSLAVDGPQGPEAYKISKDAEVTVIIYKKKKVVANHAFDSFDATCVEKVAGALNKAIN